MERVLEQARRQGARKAERLEVSVPSHCPLLQPVADLLQHRFLFATLEKAKVDLRWQRERASHARPGAHRD